MTIEDVPSNSGEKPSGSTVEILVEAVEETPACLLVVST